MAGLRRAGGRRSLAAARSGRHRPGSLLRPRGRTPRPARPAPAALGAHGTRRDRPAHRPGDTGGRRHRAGRRARGAAAVRLRARHPGADRAALPLRRIRRRAGLRTGRPGGGQHGRTVRGAERAAGHPAGPDRLLHRRLGRTGRGSRTDGGDVDRRPADLAYGPPRRPRPHHPAAARHLGRRPRGDHGARTELGAGRGHRTPHPTLAWMAATHGVGNALGFALCSVLAWRRLGRPAVHEGRTS